jgi:hypothetical protein
VNIARAARHARLRLIIPALALAIAALIIPFSQIASAQATARAVPSGGPKPTIVLEHGAWALERCLGHLSRVRGAGADAASPYRHAQDP